MYLSGKNIKSSLAGALTGAVNGLFGGGYQTLYGHATKITVKEGQKVSTGDVIGYVGSTGDSTGAHLHFETRIDGERVNPQGSRINLEKY